MDFPEREEQPPRDAPEEPEPTLVFTTVLEKKEPPKKPAEDKPIPEIVPENVGRKLGTIRRSRTRRPAGRKNTSPA